MTSGGARTRSGPRPDENSARSDKRGFRLRTLDATGYKGQVPKFPLPEPSTREAEVWRALWSLPQGNLWSTLGFQWLHGSIALYVRQLVKCEQSEVGASQIAQLHRFADQIGMTANGLSALGYKIGEPEEMAPNPGRPGALQRSRDRARGLRMISGDEAS